MTVEKFYEEWKNLPNLKEEEREALSALSGQKLEDAFYQELSFGTAGLRGELGVGTNRMNARVIARATQGLANTIARRGAEAKARGVVIAWDVRHQSREFMEVAAGILASNGIKVYVFDDIRPTPMLSFAVRYKGAISGIVITASHNPKQYNGYKVYWEEGSQIRDDIAQKISREIDKLGYELVDGDFHGYLKAGLIEVMGEDVDRAYYEATLAMSASDDVDKDLNIVYTPLNGTGNLPVRKVLKARGFQNVHVVEEQELPDPDFTTVGYPNPEDPKAFALAVEYGKNLGADLLVATDPDSDRVAMMSPDDEGNFYAYNGNQIGALLIHYILEVRGEKGDLPENAAMVKSIVTGELGTAIAREYDIPMFNTLTGFKNICGLANEWDVTGAHTFLFGYEESIGYTYGDHVRDKDAVVSTMMIVEMAAYYKKRGQSLYEVLRGIYEKYGYYKERLLSVVKEGQEGQAQIARIMDHVRQAPFTTVGDLAVERVVDYLEGQGAIGKSNVIEFHLEDGSRFTIRPSGTEPKIKLYIYTVDGDEAVAEEKLGLIEGAVTQRFEEAL
ncbi:MAG: phospho-sugar mutase [Tissierellia bacterium]|nr:phospho-sugar mutase [Tissierellia bacterium]